MPKLWTKTIETHRRDVRDALLDAAAALVAERGLLSVTISEVAERTGIGRATLYKYFPDVEAILLAWHERQIARHLAYLAEVGGRAGPPIERLAAVLEAYAFIQHEHHGSASHREHLADAHLKSLLHGGGHRVRAQRQLERMIADLVKETADAGEVRTDVEPDELAAYCLHALAAAGALGSKAAVRRLVQVTMTGLLAPR